MNRRTKRVVALTMLCLFLLTISAFAQSPQVTIKWWTFPWWNGITGQETDGTPFDWPQLKAEQFTEMYPNVKIEIELLDWNQGRQKLDIVAAAGTGGPDIITEDGPNILKYAMMGALEPVDQFLADEELADYFDVALESGLYQGSHWFFPWKLSPTSLVANKVVFEEQGLTHLLPAKDEVLTPEEFTELLKAVSGDGVWGFAMNLREVGLKSPMESIFLGYGGDIFAADGVTVELDSESVQEGVQYLADLQNVHGVTPPGMAAMSYSEMNNLWLNGQLAVRPGNNLVKLDLDTSLQQGLIEEGKIELYPLMFPAVPNSNPKTFVVVHAIGVFKQQDDYKREMVGEFARFLTTPDNIAEAAFAGYGFPSRVSSGNPFEGDPFMDYMLDSIQFGDANFSNPYYHTVSRQFITPMLQAIYSGQKTVEQAVRDAAREANQYVSRLQTAQ